jgi:hypothetical protein
MAGDAAAPAFRARLERLGINYCVDVPPRVSRALGGARYIPVTGTAAGRALRSTLVPRGGGRHRLFLDGSVRDPAALQVGDRVDVSLALDTSPRPAIPDDLADALEAVDGAPAAFVALPPGMYRSVLRWLAEAKRPETRAGRIERIVDEALRRSRP